MPIAEKTAFAGGNTWGIESSISGMNDEEGCETYVTNAVFKGFVGREDMQHIDDRSEPLEQLSITLLEFVKRPGLFLKYIKDRIGSVTAIDLGGERVAAEIFPTLFCVLLQGSIEKGLEIGRGGRCIKRQGHGITGKMSDVSGGRG